MYSSKKRRCRELGTSSSSETLGMSVGTFEETFTFEGMYRNECGKDIKCKKGCYFSSQCRAKAKCQEPYHIEQLANMKFIEGSKYTICHTNKFYLFNKS